MFLILMRTSSTQAISEKWAYLSWCEDCPELLPWMKDDRGPSSRASALFEFFKSRLVSTDYNLIAYYMLEILSLLALHDNKRLLVDVPKLSWIALHTVYIDSHEQDDSSITSSFAQSHALQMLAARRSSSFVKTQRQVVESTIVKLSETTPFALKFVPYRQYLLRHWALITRSTGQLKLFSVHLVSLVDELRSIISIVDKAIKGRSRKTTSSATQNEESPPARPSLPFLDGTTFPDYFETLAVMIVGSVSVTEPAADGSAPYSHVKKLFQIFRHLMEVYRSGFQLFPRRATSFVFHLTRDMMTASIAQLHAASEWRSSQPLLSVTDRMAGAFDVGALSHFHDLVDSMASNVVGTAVALYEFCLEGDAGLQFPFQRTGMRSSVEKAELEVKDIARLHNLPPPSFRLESAEKSTGALEVAEPTAGFHNADTSEIETSLQGPDQSDHEDPEEMHKSALGGDSTDGEDSSFGVAGGWGGDGSDDDEDSSGSLDLQASTFLRST